MKFYIQSILLHLLFLCVLSFAGEAVTDTSKTEVTSQKKYLHISTTPYTADVFVNKHKPDYAKKPDYISPDFIELQEKDKSVLISLFKKGYADTTIKVTLSPKDTSYFIVSLQPDYDPAHADAKDKILAKRMRRSVGRVLIGVSFIPLLTSATTAFFCNQQLNKAKDSKEKIENSLIRDGEGYNSINESFKDHRDNAKIYKKATYAGLIAGAAFLSVGLILSF